MLNKPQSSLWKALAFANQVITCTKISNIPYNSIFTTKFSHSLILIGIISWDYLNLSVANEYTGDITISNKVLMYNHCCSRQISQSDCSIHIKLNYYNLLLILNDICTKLMWSASGLLQAIYVLHSSTFSCSSRISFSFFRISSPISFIMHLSNFSILIDFTSVDKLPLLNLSMAW